MSSLKSSLENAVKEAYPEAVFIASKETKLSKSISPIECPYTVEQLLNDEFYPKINERK